MKRNRAERWLAALDSEDDGAGNPLLFAIVDGKGQSWTRHRHTMLERLAQRAKAHPGGLEVWCTNLEYDLLNLFGVERIAELSLRFGKSFLCGARWRGHNVEFRDTVRHVPLGVAGLGDLLGLPKLEADLFDRDRTPTALELKRRCVRDAAITYQAARKLRELYLEVGGVPKLTLASSAYHVWVSRFWRREVRQPLLEHWTAAFEAYFGGRTEVFSVGEFRDVRVCDASSMFPWAMICRPMPLPWGRFRRVPAGTTEIEPEGFYRVRVHSDMAIPVLPYRSDHGLVFPNGSWAGWYVGCELLRLIACGGRARVLEGFTFVDSVRPFDGYIARMFERKARSQGARRLFYKLLLNALYGKFGQRGERVMAVPVSEFQNLKNPPAKFRTWAGLAMFTVKGSPPPWGNNVFPAIVTARARVRLHEEMTRIAEAGGRPLYCDTDSVFYTGGPRYPKRVDRPGLFESRGEFRLALIRAKKEYALQAADRTWQFFAKGVPFDAREAYLRNGSAEFRRPFKLREAARTGETPNVWRLVRKVRHVSFTHRGRKADGSLATVIVHD